MSLQQIIAGIAGPAINFAIGTYSGYHNSRNEEEQRLAIECGRKLFGDDFNVLNYKHGFSPSFWKIWNCTFFGLYISNLNRSIVPNDPWVSVSTHLGAIIAGTVTGVKLKQRIGKSRNAKLMEKIIEEPEYAELYLFSDKQRLNINEGLDHIRKYMLAGKKDEAEAKAKYLFKSIKGSGYFERLASDFLGYRINNVSKIATLERAINSFYSSELERVGMTFGLLNEPSENFTAYVMVGDRFVVERLKLHGFRHVVNDNTRESMLEYGNISVDSLEVQEDTNYSRIAVSMIDEMQRSGVVIVKASPDFDIDHINRNISLGYIDEYVTSIRKGKK